MAIREIVYLGDPVLRAPAEDVTVFDVDLRALVRDMFETMYHADGIGLAAPQIGLPIRVIVVGLRSHDDEDIEPQRVALVNPICLLYTSPSPRDRQKSRMPSSA